MPRKQSQASLQLQQLIDSNLQLAAAMHTYAQSNQQLAAAVAQLLEAVADEGAAEDSPPSTYLNGSPIV